VFEIDGPIVDQRHMVWSRRAARLASDVIATFDDPGRLGRSAYAYFHVPMVAGVIVTAVDELPIAHAGGDVTAGTAAVIRGGPALHLAGIAALKWTVCSHTGRGHGPWRSPSWA
jgi:low temperature requirement protein LtrA